MENPWFLIVLLCTGRSWAATSTEGLLIHSLDSRLVFDPFNLDLNVTPSSVRRQMRQHEHTDAIVQAFRLNEKKLIQEVLENVPYAESKCLISNFYTTHNNIIINPLVDL